jgi:PAS domain S-box-containing protein
VNSPAFLAKQNGIQCHVMESAIMASVNGIMIVEIGPGTVTTVFVNPAFESITGYSSDEVVGRNPGMLHEGDSDQAGLDEIRQAILAHRSVTVVLRNYRKDGALFWNELTISPVHDAENQLTHFVGILNDIGYRKRAEQELITWSMRLDALTTMSDDGLVTFDDHGILSYANDAFTRLTGLATVELRGLTFADFDLLLARQCADSGNPLRRVAEDFDEVKKLGCINNRETTIHLQQPQKRTLARRAQKGSHGTSLLLYLQDITKACEVDELKSEFLATAAHELRTPMASVLGYAELLLLRNYDAEKSRELLEIIVRQSRRVNELLNELLDLARIEARRGKDFKIGRIDVHTLLQEVVGGLKMTDSRSSVAISSPPDPLSIRADRNKVAQALSNVISNADKYSPEGGAIDIELVPPVSDHALLGIRITDHGIGMTPEQLAHVCERFYRADTSGKIPGTGLGMSIVKEIIELHGGRLELASKVGAGTTVTLWLPAGDVEVGTQAPDAFPSSPKEQKA